MAKVSQLDSSGFLKMQFQKKREQEQDKEMDEIIDDFFSSLSDGETISKRELGTLDDILEIFPDTLGLLLTLPEQSQVGVCLNNIKSLNYLEILGLAKIIKPGGMVLISNLVDEGEINKTEDSFKNKEEEDEGESEVVLNHNDLIRATQTKSDLNEESGKGGIFDDFEEEDEEELIDDLVDDEDEEESGEDDLMGEVIKSTQRVVLIKNQLNKNTQAKKQRIVKTQEWKILQDHPGLSKNDILRLKWYYRTLGLERDSEGLILKRETPGRVEKSKYYGVAIVVGGFQAFPNQNYLGRFNNEEEAARECTKWVDGELSRIKEEFSI